MKKGVNIRSVFLTKVILLFLSISLTATIGNFVTDSLTLSSVFNQPNNVNFKEILRENGMSSYISPSQIKASPGKNIIVISLESLERGYLENKYSSLTPNLNKLKKEWNYSEMKQNLGSNWTSGSIYTSLTGFPAFFGVERNSVFQKAYYSQISSISHALKKADYNTVYMNGNADYAGLKEMLFTLQFDEIIDKGNVEKNGFESQYGLRDKDLVEQAKSKVKELAKINKPFALFISTTDTHFPNGIYDARMEKFISKKNSDIEFTVASIDYLMGDFIEFLKSEDLLTNTVVYIYPDHLKMGDPNMFKDSGERSLFIISNSNNELINQNKSTPIYQIDLPKIILQGAGVDNNLKFLTDFIKGDKNKFIEENIGLITTINTNGISRINSNPINISSVSKNYCDYKVDTLRYIAHAGGEIKGYTYTNSKEALDHSYAKGFRLFELDINKSSDGSFVAVHDWKHWADITNNVTDVAISKNDFLSHKIYGEFTPLDMERINKWFAIHKDAILVTDKINDPVKFANEFTDPSRLMMELFDMKAVKEGIGQNIRSSMPSQNVIQKMRESDIESLRKIGVKNVAISRRFIADNRSLLKLLKENDIKPYVYHINFDDGIDEDYVVKYEMDYIYGIYADDWIFSNKKN
ncbi:sulfatase-like hydrolase/transferase [Gillisia sp. M10.2A]|uniref:Sulfatase-like hydrolase/transferase n=1 Tax=Gillisia lutea TaxID=2909668 RepID=A0ABS9EID7_9FLAO|nr:sulfatase-like hydrolase/transferase [Gillisia lutea]MCF4102112.1 sulfatase-like hydrolase/transferase [Gillisia lutea]